MLNVIRDFWERFRPARQRGRGGAGASRVDAPEWMPGARIAPPKAWTETDSVNLDRFFKTPSGKKFLLTLHAMTVDRALAVADRGAFGNGVTGGMSLMVGEIERLAVEGEPEGENDEEE